MSRHYGSNKQRVARNREVVAAMLPAPCVRCGAVVLPEHNYQADHIVSRYEAEQMGWALSEIDNPSNLGPAHASCNARAGGKLAAAIKKQKAAEPKRIERIERPQPRLFVGAADYPDLVPQSLSIFFTEPSHLSSTGSEK